MQEGQLRVYQELYKTGAFVYRLLEDTVLHLITIKQPTQSIAYEFGVPEVRRQLLLHLFGPEDLRPTLSPSELLLHELPVIQYSGGKPSGFLPAL
jgi:hypothetical protein